MNANAMSAPFTVGFPSVTAFMGAAHCLERHLNEIEFDNIKFEGVGIVSHNFELGVHKNKGDYIHSIIGKKAPLKKDGKPKPFIEQPRCDLTVSLLIKYSGADNVDSYTLERSIKSILMSKMKMAGGDIVPSLTKDLIVKVSDLETNFKEIKRLLMPGFFLIERSDLMQKSMMVEKLDAVDAVLNHIVTNHECITAEGEVEANDDENVKGVEWKSFKKENGWIVPICTGYHALKGPGKAKNQRCLEYDHFFVESVLTLGEFKPVYRVSEIDSILWRMDVSKIKDQLFTYNNKG